MAWEKHNARLHLRLGEIKTVFEQVLPGARKQHEDNKNNRVMAPMGNQILGVHVQPEDRVDRKQTLLTLKTMKLETNIPSPITDVIAEVRISDENQVTQRQLLMAMTKDEEEEK